MLVLAIDTSTKIGTVALYDSTEGVIGEITLNVKQNHSDTIMVVIDTLFKLSKKEIKDIDKIAVSSGPGSFTGIRIGVAVAKGLAYSLEKPIVGINELDILAELAGKRTGKIIAMLDARKERVFYAIYRYFDSNLVRESEYLDGEIRDIVKDSSEEILFLGDGAEANKTLITELMGEKAIFNLKSNNIPRSSILAELSLNKEDNLFTLEPFYVNKTQAEREKENQEKLKNTYI
ncbi:MAG: tRNA (adenosine(37)-N6)-threonylcarbamoyltransferase complex dimerization subunit type 1 TsaB [Cetobacterium sp.]